MMVSLKVFDQQRDVNSVLETTSWGFWRTVQFSFARKTDRSAQECATRVRYLLDVGIGRRRIKEIARQATF